MVIDSSAGPLPSETALPTKERAAASPLGSLVRLLARQAAREVVTSGLELHGVAPDDDVGNKPSRRRALGREIGSIR
jgi:hypothetical protein